MPLFTFHEFEKWLSNKSIPTLENRNLAYSKMSSFRSLILEGNISHNELTRVLPLLKREAQSGDIICRSLKEFEEVSKMLSGSIGSPETIFRDRIEHEMGHAQVYEKYKIDFELGWSKVLDEKNGAYAFIPFCRIDEDNLDWILLPYKDKLEIQIESLQNVAQMSEGDEELLKDYKKELKNLK